MSFIEQQAPDAVTPPSEQAPGLSLALGLSLAQELLARLIFALVGALIVGQINRMLARFVHMRDLWVAGQLPNLPPPPARAKSANPRRRQSLALLQTPRIRPERAPRTLAEAQPAVPAPHSRAAPARPSVPANSPTGIACRLPRQAHPLPQLPLRFFALRARVPNCVLIVPYTNRSAIIGISTATP